MKNRINVTTRLMLAFGSLLVVVLGLAWSSWWFLGTMAGHLHTALNITARKIGLIQETDKAIIMMREGQRGLVAYSTLKQPARADVARAQFTAATRRITELTAELGPLLVTEQGRRDVEAIVAGVNAWQPLFTELSGLCSAQQFDDKLLSVLDKTLAVKEPMVRSSADLLETLRSVNKRAELEATADASKANWIALLFVGICLALGGFVLFTVRRISLHLRRLAAELAGGAEQVASAAAEISSSSQALARGSSQQAASLEETSASSQEINSMTHRNADNSRLAAENMAEASRRIEEADQNLEAMMASMNEINASSDKISKIIKVIDEIAFQTNILALNAAVEAARAGEAGMGFAVVADEVRNLAQRSAQAARDTAELIEESIAKSSDGQEKLGLVATAVRSITESAAKANMLVEEVKLGSSEQANGIAQVSKAILQMEQTTQQTAAMAEQSAAASEELTAQSGALKAAVAELKRMVGENAEFASGRPAKAVRQTAAVVAAPVPAPAAKVAGVPKPPAVPSAMRSKPDEMDMWGPPPGAFSSRENEFPLDSDD